MPAHTYRSRIRHRRRAGSSRPAREGSICPSGERRRAPRGRRRRTGDRGARGCCRDLSRRACRPYPVHRRGRRRARHRDDRRDLRTGCRRRRPRAADPAATTCRSTHRACSSGPGRAGGADRLDRCAALPRRSDAGFCAPRDEFACPCLRRLRDVDRGQPDHGRLLPRSGGRSAGDRPASRFLGRRGSVRARRPAGIGRMAAAPRRRRGRARPDRHRVARTTADHRRLRDDHSGSRPARRGGR